MPELNQKPGVRLIATIIYLLACSCLTHEKTNTVKDTAKDKSPGNGKIIISTPVVVKKSGPKDGDVTDHYDIYIQRSMRDYFIKFCESKLSREDLENHLAGIDSKIKVLTLEVEFLKGYWDVCDDNFDVPSRKGEYVIIHRVID